MCALVAKLQLAVKILLLNNIWIYSANLNVINASHLEGTDEGFELEMKGTSYIGIYIVVYQNHHKLVHFTLNFKWRWE